MQSDDPTTEPTEAKAATPSLEQLAASDTDGDGTTEFDEVMVLLADQDPQVPVDQVTADADVDESLLERLSDAVLRAQVAADVNTDGRLTAGDLLTWLQQR